MIRLLILFLLPVVSSTLLAQRPADNVLAAMEREAQELMQQEKFQEAVTIFDKIISCLMPHNKFHFLVVVPISSLFT